MNRFLIDEEAQNECLGVYKENHWSLPSSHHLIEQLLRIEDVALKSTFVHVIRAAKPWRTSASFGKLFDIVGTPRTGKSKLRNLIRSISNFKVVLTQLSSERIECVRKEKYEKLHKEGVRIDTSDWYNDHFSTVSQNVIAEKSVGDDIEDFYQEMESEKLCPRKFIQKEKQKIGRINVPGLKYEIQTFHLPMLSDEEEKKMERSNPSYGKTTQKFKHRPKLSKNEHNYALSVCSRRTFASSDWYSSPYRKSEDTSRKIEDILRKSEDILRKSEDILRRSDISEDILRRSDISDELIPLPEELKKT